MKLAFVLLALMLLSQGNFIVADDGPVSSAIYIPMIIPHLVTFTSSGRSYCSGALISDMKTVITVPACFNSTINNVSENTIEVSAGTMYKKTSGVRKIIDENGHHIYVALSEPFNRSEKISNLILPKDDSYIPFDTATFFNVACRWSVRNNRGVPGRPVPEDYISAHLPLKLKRSCEKLSSVNDSDLYFCAEIYLSTCTKFCEIDIGTPLNFNHKLIGIVSKKIDDTYLVLNVGKAV